MIQKKTVWGKLKQLITGNLYKTSVYFRLVKFCCGTSFETKNCMDRTKLFLRSVKKIIKCYIIN